MFEMKRRKWEKTLREIQSILQDDSRPDRQARIDAAVYVTRIIGPKPKPVKPIPRGREAVSPLAATFSFEVLKTILAHLRLGDRIGAIKVIRENNGMGIREAKEAVDTDPTFVAAFSESNESRRMRSSQRSMFTLRS